jgi:hypothetical protein
MYLLWEELHVVQTKSLKISQPFKDRVQTTLFKDPVRTAL